MLELPMPPSGNHRNVGSGRNTRHSPKYAAFLEEVGWRCRIAGITPFEGPVRCDVAIYYHPSHEPDCDNILKAVHDALQGYWYTDDRLIVAGSYSKQPDKQYPRVEVSVRSIA